MDEASKASFLANQMISNGTLPAISENIKAICDLNDDSGTGVIDLAEIIMRDCGLTTTLLSTANSTFYSPRTPITTVSGASSFLGLRKVKSLALGLEILNQHKDFLRKRDLIKLYANSYFTATFSRALANRESSSRAEEMFVAGLLYQLPRLGLANTLPDDYHKMNTLINDLNYPESKAFKEAFGTTYQALSLAVCETYNLPENISEIIMGQNQDTLSEIIRESTAIANMLFCEKGGGQKEIKTIETNICGILDIENFDLTAFIEKTFKDDKNIQSYFNLERDDIHIMIKLLEWGKSNPAGIAMQLDFRSAEEKAEIFNRPEVLIGKYITDMMVALKEGKELNLILLTAQEALRRCIPNSYTFMTFIDLDTHLLEGKFYSGEHPKINAEDFSVNLVKLDSPLITCVRTAKPGSWKHADGSTGLPKQLTYKMKLKNALFRPIIAFNKVIGLYFIGRDKSAGEFSNQEQIWFEEISDHINKTFEKF